MQPRWDEMDREPSRSVATLQAVDIPVEPGVYALYLDEDRIYVGKASSLRNRIWRNHLGRGAVMANSALRRNVAQHLGIATAADLKEGRYQPTLAEVQAIRSWLDGCDIAWRVCQTPSGAMRLEAAMKLEFMPPLTKR